MSRRNISTSSTRLMKFENYRRKIEKMPPTEFPDFKDDKKGNRDKNPSSWQEGESDTTQKTLSLSYEDLLKASEELGLEESDRELTTHDPYYTARRNQKIKISLLVAGIIIVVVGLLIAGFIIFRKG